MATFGHGLQIMPLWILIRNSVSTRNPLEGEFPAMHDTPLNRRSFLHGAAAGGVLLSLGLNGSLVRADEISGNPKPGKIKPFKISLAQWSLHKALRANQLDNLDFPKVAREEYGIEGVEFVNQFFKDKAHDAAYLKDLKKRADDQGVACVLIMIDGEGDLSAGQGSANASR